MDRRASAPMREPMKDLEEPLTLKPYVVNVELDPSLTFGENRAAINDAFERDYITMMFKRHNGNISSAAREAQADRKHIHDLAKKHGITRRSLGIR